MCTRAFSLVVMASFWDQRAFFRCSKSNWDVISLPVNLSSSLLLELELTKEISSLDSIEPVMRMLTLLDR